MDIASLYDELMDLEPTAFSFDSRTLQPTEIFCALRGAKTDGHQFIPEAIAKGAKALLVDQRDIVFPSIKVFYVEDVLATLHQLAKHKIKICQPKIVGITGSVGKTTTKEFLYTLLSPFFPVSKPIKSYNSQITLPITILNFPKESEIYLLEMGMSSKGEIDRLIQIAEPDLAILTHVSPSHIGQYQSIQEIGFEKQKIFTPKTYYRLVNHEALPYLNIEGILTYGPLGSGADFEYAQQGNNVQIYFENRASPWIAIPFNYAHFIQNVIGAFLVARQFNLGWDHIQQAAHHLNSEEHRCQVVHKKGIVFFDDAYNASESSFKAAYEACPIPSSIKKRISVVGAIHEQGFFSLETHLNVAQYALGYCDVMFCIGEETRPMVELFRKHQRPAYFFENKQDLINSLRAEVSEGDVVLVKGSNSFKLWEIIDQI